MEDENVIVEFKAVLILILDLLEHGDIDRAKEKIREILKE